jgi:DNA invertase Pin-like site-specific DNA recombinase
MNTVIYIRWSSAEQSKGSSLERQRDDCRRYAEAKGWRRQSMVTSWSAASCISMKPTHTVIF